MGGKDIIAEVAALLKAIFEFLKAFIADFLNKDPEAEG